MLDYNLYRIIDIDGPLGIHVDKYYKVPMLFPRGGCDFATTLRK